MSTTVRTLKISFSEIQRERFWETGLGVLTTAVLLYQRLRKVLECCKAIACIEAEKHSVAHLLKYSVVLSSCLPSVAEV